MATNVTTTDILERLMAQYNSGGYKKKTDEELKAQAAGEYQTYYDQLRLAAQQEQQRNDLALQQQKAALDYAFQKQQEASQKEYEQVYSQADRQLLSRGMQRSSYGAQTLANIRQQQADVFMDLEGQKAAQGSNIEAQRVQLGDQLAAQLNQYDAAQAADELNRLRELQDQEYERGLENDALQNDLALQLYDMLGTSGGGGGSGGGSGGGNDGTTTGTDTQLPTQSGYDALMSAINATNTASSTASGLVSGVGNTQNMFQSLSLPSRLATAAENKGVGATKTLYGPINTDRMNTINKTGVDPVTGMKVDNTVKYESDLYNKLKNKK